MSSTEEVACTGYVTEDGTRRVTVETPRTVYPMSGETADAIHAFIEAERNEWHWTNADKTEARKGRWVVRRADTQLPALYHDDFEGILYGPGDAHLDVSEWNATIKSKEVYHDFLAWHESQRQKEAPQEPTDLGAVVEVPDLEPCEPGAVERFVYTGESSHNQKPWALAEDGKIRVNWDYLLTRVPITILSAGESR